jgi:hypothetical protein
MNLAADLEAEDIDIFRQIRVLAPPQLLAGAAMSMRLA